MRIAAITAAVTSLVPGAQGSQRSRGDRGKLLRRGRRDRRFNRRQDVVQLGRDDSALRPRGNSPGASRASRRALPCFEAIGCRFSRANAGASEPAARSTKILSCAPGREPAPDALSGQRNSQAAVLHLISPAGRSNFLIVALSIGSFLLKTHAGSVGILLTLELREYQDRPASFLPQTGHHGGICPEFCADASTGLRDVSRGVVLRGSDRLQSPVFPGGSTLLLFLGAGARISKVICAPRFVKKQ